ncbi:MAG: hypothetical protein ACXAAO_11780 [Candidatus Thorarchaeota archaeon]|jgi:hypothetical protein
MEDLPLYPDGAHELVSIPILETLRNAFRDILLENPQDDMLLRDEPYGTLVYVKAPPEREFDPEDIRLVRDTIDKFRTIGAMATMGENVKTFYYLARLKLEGFQSSVMVLFQGGFVEESVVVISTMSIGTIYDYSIPRGSVVINGDDGPVHMSLTNCGDNSAKSLANPIAAALKTELSNKESRFLKLMSKQLQIGAFVTSRNKQYTVKGSSIFSMIPHQGKTVVSILLTPLNMKPASIGQSFPMRMLGRDKPVQLEVSIPSEEKMKTALAIIKRYQQLPDNLRTNESPTSTLSGYGVSALLSLDIAQSIFVPERPSLSLYEIFENGHYYRKTADSLRAEFKDIDIYFKGQFPTFLIYK